MSDVALLPPRRPAAPLRIGVLISGRGSNLRALLEEKKAGRLPFAEFAVVVSNRWDAGGLSVAAEHGIPTAVVEHRDFGKDRSAHEAAMIRVLEQHRVEFLVLAGYMRLLTPTLLDAYADRMINIHPSLLPAFPGVDAQTQAFNYGVKVAGCTAHFVIHEMDAGQIILQRTVPVRATDTAESLQQRILVEEHKALPLAVDLASRRRLYIDGRKVFILAGAGSFPDLEKEIESVFPLFAATGNAHKVEEIGAILSDLPLLIQGTNRFEEITEPVEDAADYHGNALIKAQFWQHRTRGWALADDSGLEVDALDGRPGIHSSRYAATNEARIARLLRELDGVPLEKRTARFRCCVVLCGPNGECHHAMGTCEGHIAHEPRGAHGFGYDPVFVPNGFGGRHLAELDSNVKNQISHRANALKGIRPQIERLIKEASQP